MQLHAIRHASALEIRPEHLEGLGTAAPSRIVEGVHRGEADALRQARREQDRRLAPMASDLDGGAARADPRRGVVEDASLRGREPAVDLHRDGPRVVERRWHTRNLPTRPPVRGRRPALLCSPRRRDARREMHDPADVPRDRRRPRVARRTQRRRTRPCAHVLRRGRAPRHPGGCAPGEALAAARAIDRRIDHPRGRDPRGLLDDPPRDGGSRGRQGDDAGARRAPRRGRSGELHLRRARTTESTCWSAQRSTPSPVSSETATVPSTSSSSTRTRRTTRTTSASRSRSRVPGRCSIVDNVVRGGTVARTRSPTPTPEAPTTRSPSSAAEPRVEATVLQVVGAKGHDGLLFGLVTS